MSFLEYLDWFFRSPVFPVITAFFFFRATFKFAGLSLNRLSKKFNRNCYLFCFINTVIFVALDIFLYQSDFFWIAYAAILILVLTEVAGVSRDRPYIYIFLVLGLVFVLLICNLLVLVLIGLAENNSYSESYKNRDAVTFIDGATLLLSSIYLAIVYSSKQVDIKRWKRVIHSGKPGLPMFLFFVIFDILCIICVLIINPVVFFNEHANPTFKSFMLAMIAVVCALVVSSAFMVVYFFRAVDTTAKNSILENELDKEHDSAQKDPLTGLLNRRGFEEAVENSLRRNECGALYLLDLDNFKSVNDRLGHPIGDELLKSVSLSLKSIFDEEDYIARLGGDEFVVYAAGLNELRVVEKYARSIVKNTVKRLRPNDGYGDIIVSASVGISMAKINTDDYQALYAEADKALYEAKEAGKSTYRISSKKL